MDVDFSADVFQDLDTDLWGLVREYVEGHLEDTLPSPRVSASWGTHDNNVWRPMLVYATDVYGPQIGWC